MRGKLLLTFLAGLVVGLAASFLAWRPQALAERPEKPPEWEYRLVRPGTDPKEQSKVMDELGSGGWEYVGPVSLSASTENFQATSTAFRRPKK
jgi:hypothetical protein